MTGYGRFGPESGLVSQPQFSASISGGPDGPPGATPLCVYIQGFRASGTQIVSQKNSTASFTSFCICHRSGLGSDYVTDP